MRSAVITCIFALVTTIAVSTQTNDQKISDAIKALPESMREGAAVVEYDADGYRTVIREGSNSLVCEPDDPNVEGFRVGCYHQNRIARLNFERQFAATGKSAAEVFQARSAKVDAGLLPLPVAGQMAYFLAGADEASATPTRSVRLPYATSESTGLPIERGQDGVWLMQAGTNRAHIMIVGNGGETGQTEGTNGDSIAEAVSPLAPALRSGATVVRYNDNGKRDILRQGNNSIVCEPDDSAVEGFRVSCYHEGHVPRLNFEKELAATGIERGEVFAARVKSVEAGRIPLPVAGQMQYFLGGEDIASASSFKGIRLPYATSASSGLPTERSSDNIWLMQAGTNRAHIMLPGR